MTELKKPSTESLETLEITSRYEFDLNKIQVAPQRMPEFVEFKALSLAERQALLEKLIARVRSL